MWQTGFLVRFTKKCDIQCHFSFCCIWINWKDVFYAHDMWLFILFLFFFLIVLNLLIDVIDGPNDRVWYLKFLKQKLFH